MALPPPPINSDPGSYAWNDWYVKLQKYVSVSGVPWSAVDKTGSNITDVASRKHNDLQSIAGGLSGEYNHLSNAEYGKITYLANVTSDIQAQINLKAPKDSPAFTTAVGFNGSAPVSKPTITGSRGGNVALADLLTKLASYGLITDGTTV